MLHQKKYMQVFFGTDESLAAGQTESEIDISDDEADAAFAEGSGESKVSSKADESENSQENKDGEDDSNASTGSSETGSDGPGPEANQSEEGKTDNQQAGDGQPTIESLQAEVERLKKISDDNHKFGRTEADKAAKLEKELAELRAKAPTEDLFKDASEDVKEFLADNPGAVEVVKTLAQQIAREQFGGLDPVQVQSQMAQMSFMNTIAFGYQGDDGSYIGGHPDAPTIVHTQEFKDFATAEKINPEAITAAEAIKLISKFKRSKAEKGAKDTDTANRQKASQVKDFAGAAGSSLGSGTKQAEGQGAVDSGDPDNWFKEGAETEKKRLTV